MRTSRSRSDRLRIIAGSLGGRRIQYDGNPDTRPMKEKTREAVFSLLGGYLYGNFAIDLFAGTGVLGFESVSRGATGALLLELSRPVVTTLLANMRALGLSDRVRVQNVDTLRWMRGIDAHSSGLPDEPWVIYCCPPYALWKNRTDRMIDGLKNLHQIAPTGSRIVCEAESSFDLEGVLPGWDWDIRQYKPAQIGICSTGVSELVQ
jgi:16S rRNA (guanine966-N2)-methyltransferase